MGSERRSQACIPKARIQGEKICGGLIWHMGGEMGGVSACLVFFLFTFEILAAELKVEEIEEEASDWILSLPEDRDCVDTREEDAEVVGSEISMLGKLLSGTSKSFGDGTN